MVSGLGLTTKIFALASLLLSNGWAKNVPYQETLAQLYPKCQFRKENIFLTSQQKKYIEKHTDQKLYSQMALRYHVDCKGEKPKLKRLAYIDSHIVRTLNETVVVIINSDNRIESFKISSFMEPSEYIPPKNWIDQLLNKGPTDSYSLNQEVDGLSGATLSANAVVNASKRILKLHEVLGEDKK